jgi:uncharacterized protein YbjT (DUF2867 family)
MRTLIIGANGKVGRLLVPLLVDAGHDVRTMIRDEAQAPAQRELGAEPLVADLEGDFGHAVDGCDAVVFTAGSGGHTGADKTVAVDGLGAIRAVEEARDRGARRFVMVSSRGADDPDRSQAIRHYLVAKGIADGFLQRSGLDYTILRPGRLTDDPPTGGSGRANAWAPATSRARTWPPPWSRRWSWTSRSGRRSSS